MTLKVEGDPGYGSVSAGGRFTDLDSSETVPLLIPDIQQQRHVWKPLSREELEKCAGGPEWKKFRSRLVLCFWIGWLIMLGTVIAIIIQSPRTESPSLHWWQRDVFFMDADSDKVSRISSDLKLLPHVKSLGVRAVILEGLFQHDISPPNLTEIDQSLGTLPQFTQLITESRKAGVRAILDLCELDLFEQESGNGTDVWSSPSEYIQYSLRHWLEHGVSGFGICDTDATLSAKTLMECSVLMQKLNSQDDESILMVRQTGNTLPELNVSMVNGSLVELVVKSLIPPPLHHSLFPAEVAEAMEASLQMPQGHWPSWTISGGVQWELERAILVLIMTLPGTPIFRYGDEVNPVQDLDQLNQPLALFHSLSQSRAREETLSFNASMSSSGFNSTVTPPLAFLRSWGCVHFLVLFNLGSEPHTLDPDWAPCLPEGGVFVTSTGLDRFGPVSLRSIKMQPHEAVVIKVFESDNS
ncbi:4F2 cell-surface antigen heavy chain-like [Sinocyclocheilus rhinocerous]|uniref:4F2 cell-surface antigen heavy chain-like n=1 Tax=Sinocyclocheilus rhinocerous TaxID=307959 RepID=UPI0007BAA28B|nr:PREDICTED: 4F2 cell-surface antigen heavy chain-like [Sinocyclocheilus rhinocerous]